LKNFMNRVYTLIALFGLALICIGLIILFDMSTETIRSIIPEICWTENYRTYLIIGGIIVATVSTVYLRTRKTPTARKEP